MFKINNFMDNDDVKTIEQLNGFSVIEYQRDLSVTPSTAQMAYFSNQMNIKKRQLVCDLKQGDVREFTKEELESVRN